MIFNTTKETSSTWSSIQAFSLQILLLCIKQRGWTVVVMAPYKHPRFQQALKNGSPKDPIIWAGQDPSAKFG